MGATWDRGNPEYLGSAEAVDDFLDERDKKRDDRLRPGNHHKHPKIAAIIDRIRAKGNLR